MPLDDKIGRLRWDLAAINEDRLFLKIWRCNDVNAPAIVWFDVGRLESPNWSHHM